MARERFEQMLTGGHPNSLGRTLEVVEAVLADKRKLEQLYNCYFSADAVVRLRTSSGLKRVTLEKPDWVVPYLDRLLDEIARIDQASTQWTLAILFAELHGRMTAEQRTRAKRHLKSTLAHHDDWIVLNTAMQTLADWAKADKRLRTWLLPQLVRLSTDRRKAVSRRAAKLHGLLVSA
ncbi:MAG: hypothetical protein AAF460_09830 [Pseudomonadota bacterium]